MEPMGYGMETFDGDCEADRLRAFLELIAEGIGNPVQLAKDALDGNEPPMRGCIVMVPIEHATPFVVIDVQ